MRKLFTCFALLLVSYFNSYAQTADRKDWINVGSTNKGADPYEFLYYKIAQLNDSSDRYATIMQVAFAGDANYYTAQGSFEVRIDKWELSTNRFDGVEVRCISGNPNAGIFYVFNNAVWVASAYKWGTINLRVVGDLAANSPRPATSFPSSITAPTGALVVAQGFGVKCNMDNNGVNKLPYSDFMGNLNLGGVYTVESGQEAPKLAVNGLVVAKKIKVSQANTWADFVFDPSYKLPALSEVENYIKDNGHLPNIPSEQEVLKDGIDLGNMNKLLLQKVEELTLYLIQLKKENDALKEQNQSIIDQNRSILKQLQHK